MSLWRRHLRTIAAHYEDVRRLPRPILGAPTDEHEYFIPLISDPRVSCGIICERCGSAVFTAQRYSGCITLACWSCPTFIGVMPKDKPEGATREASSEGPWKWAVDIWGPICTECGIRFDNPSPRCPHQLSNVHPLSKGNT